MEFHGKFQKLDFNDAEYRKRFDERVKAGLRQAARLWLRAVIERVPVWTGTSRGTLLPLAQMLRVAIPIKPVAFRSGRGPAFGPAYSAYEFYASDGVYAFEFDQNLPYYILNDFNLVSFIPSTPWHSFDAGTAAFNAYVNNQLFKSLPKLKDYIKTVEIKF
jgi:hypothetical protein